MKRIALAASLALPLLVGCVDYEVCTTHYSGGEDAGELWSVRYLREERPHRPWVAWHRNARAALYTNYAGGKRDGTWRTYDAEGRLLFERSYQDDLPSGEWKRFWRDGKPYESGRFERGLKVGTWKRHGPGGALLEEASFYEGRYQGERRLYDMDGRLLRSERYLAGVLQE